MQSDKRQITTLKLYYTGGIQFAVIWSYCVKDSKIMHIVLGKKIW